MKKGSLIAFIFIGGVIFYVTGGGALLGIMPGRQHKSTQTELMPPADSRTYGERQDNPFVRE